MSDVFWTVSGDSGVVYKIHSSSSSAPGTYRHDNFSSGVVLEIVFVSRMENVFCSNYLIVNQFSSEQSFNYKCCNFFHLQFCPSPLNESRYLNFQVPLSWFVSYLIWEITKVIARLCLRVMIFLPHVWHNINGWCWFSELRCYWVKTWYKSNLSRQSWAQRLKKNVWTLILNL